MIIKIEDAPNIKNLKIDISFDDDGTVRTMDIKPDIGKSKESKTTKSPKLADVELNLDETFDIPLDIVKKPEIPDVVREVRVSDDMQAAEF